MAYQIYLEKSKEKEQGAALLYCLKAQLEHMQSQCGYVKTLDSETITAWSGGQKTERNRLEWIAETEDHIATCLAHIAEMEQIG